MSQNNENDDAFMENNDNNIQAHFAYTTPSQSTTSTTTSRSLLHTPGRPLNIRTGTLLRTHTLNTLNGLRTMYRTTPAAPPPLPPLPLPSSPSTIQQHHRSVSTDSFYSATRTQGQHQGAQRPQQQLLNRPSRGNSILVFHNEEAVHNEEAIRSLLASSTIPSSQRTYDLRSRQQQQNTENRNVRRRLNFAENNVDHNILIEDDNTTDGTSSDDSSYSENWILQTLQDTMMEDTNDLFNEIVSTNHILDFSSLVVPRFPRVSKSVRKRISLQRENICETLMTEAKDWTDHDILQGFDFCVENEDGQDLGGVTTDILYNFWHGLRALQPNFFQSVNSNSDGNLEKFVLTADPFVTRRFSNSLYGIGRILLFTLVHRGKSFVWPYYWDHIDIKFFMQEKLTLEDLERIGHSIVQCLKSDNLFDSLKDWREALDLDQYVDFNWMETKDLIQIISEKLLWQPRLQNLLEVKRGFDFKGTLNTPLGLIEIKGGWTKIKGFLDKVLNTFEEFRQQIDYGASNSIPQDHKDCIDRFFKVVQSWSTADLQKLLKFITGSIHIPLKNKIVLSIDTAFKSDPLFVERFPRASTCTNALSIPLSFGSISLSKINKKLRQAIEESTISLK